MDDENCRESMGHEEGSRYVFAKTPDPFNPHDLATVRVAFSTSSLEDVIESFHDFLRASGFGYVTEIIYKTNSE